MSSSVSSAHQAATHAQVTPATRRSRRWLWLSLTAVAVLLAGGMFAMSGPLDYVRSFFGSDDDEAMYYVVEPTTLNVTLKEDGELKPVNSIKIKCEVQGQGMQGITIEEIVDESTRVQKGDLLVRLSSEEIQDRVETEEMELRRLNVELENAKQALVITRSDNESKIKKAEVDLGVAKLELEKYTLGDYEKAKKTIEIDIAQTELQKRRTLEELRKSEPLRNKGFLPDTKIEELQDEIKRLDMMLAKHELAMEILNNYERKKNTMQKESAVERAGEELQREQERAASREKQALTRIEDHETALEQRTQRYERLKEQLEACVIYAPCDGVVQYGDSGGRWRRNRIAAGESVAPGQTLITIPDTSQMMVSTRIHEADRHKLREGLTCLVKVPAVPGQTFTGKLKKIAQFADSERGWLNPDLKEHAAEILLDETDAPVSPGDTAHIEILIEEIPDALAVPVQSVFSRGAQHFVFVQRGLSAQPVEVELGAATETMVEVVSGLKAGQKVVMAPDESLLALLPTPGSVLNGAS